MTRGLDERLQLIRLLDTYGGLLTLRQRGTMRLYYLDDLSLGEIGQRQGVTRQAVRDSLQRSIGELRRFERHLKLVRDGRSPQRQDKRRPGMTTHYFTPMPETAPRRRTLTATLRGRRFVLETDRAVFAQRGIDRGSRLLIESMTVGPRDLILDLGCGYGVIGLAAAALAPQGWAHLVDVNERAVDLGRENAAVNRITNVTVHLGNGVSPVAGLTFDLVLTNPPIRAGRPTVLAFFAGAHRVLRSRGRFLFVARTGQGARTLARHAEALFGNVNEIAKGGGFRVYAATKMATERRRAARV